MFDNMGNEGLQHGHRNTQELPCLPEASASASYAAWGTLEYFNFRIFQAVPYTTYSLIILMLQIGQMSRLPDMIVVNLESLTFGNGNTIQCRTSSECNPSLYTMCSLFTRILSSSKSNLLSGYHYHVHENG